MKIRAFSRSRLQKHSTNFLPCLLVYSSLFLLRKLFFVSFQIQFLLLHSNVRQNHNMQFTESFRQFHHRTENVQRAQTKAKKSDREHDPSVDLVSLIHQRTRQYTMRNWAPARHDQMKTKSAFIGSTKCDGTVACLTLQNISQKGKNSHKFKNHITPVCINFDVIKVESCNLSAAWQEEFVL